MKWLFALSATTIIFILIMMLIFGFNALMNKQERKWMDSNSALGIFPKIMVSLHSFLSKHILIVASFLFIVCLTGALITAARKKQVC